MKICSTTFKKLDPLLHNIFTHNVWTIHSTQLTINVCCWNILCQNKSYSSTHFWFSIAVLMFWSYHKQMRKRMRLCCHSWMLTESENIKFIFINLHQTRICDSGSALCTTTSTALEWQLLSKLPLYNWLKNKNLLLLLLLVIEGFEDHVLTS